MSLEDPVGAIGDMVAGGVAIDGYAQYNEDSESTETGRRLSWVCERTVGNEISVLQDGSTFFWGEGCRVHRDFWARQGFCIKNPRFLPLMGYLTYLTYKTTHKFCIQHFRQFIFYFLHIVV
jgi:hypothetical protein